jgi:hypothetical protein
VSEETDKDGVKGESGMNVNVADEISETLKDLTPQEQLRVLEYARSLSRSPTGTPGRILTSAAAGITDKDLDLMRNAIEQGCERINPSDW